MATSERTASGGDFPPSWKPQTKGESIEGELTRISTTPKGMVYEVASRDGKKTVWGSKLLDECLKEVNAAVGIHVKITWLGKVTGQKGQSYHTWRVDTK